MIMKSGGKKNPNKFLTNKSHKKQDDLTKKKCNSNTYFRATEKNVIMILNY